MEPNSTKFDLIILGASGFTGKYVLKEALKFLNTPSSPLTSIAIAGRSPTKLAQTLQWASKPNPPPSLPILHADTTDPSSLRALCSQTHLILNCVGPFRHHGEPVVAACTDTGCAFEHSFLSSLTTQFSRDPKCRVLFEFYRLNWAVDQNDFSFLLNCFE